MDNPFEVMLDRLRHVGWQQGHEGGISGPNCLHGAARYTGITGYGAFILTIIQEQYPEHSAFPGWQPTIMSFNDHPDTTFADVERVLEKAAVKWEEERVLNG